MGALGRVGGVVEEADGVAGDLLNGRRFEAALWRAEEGLAGAAAFLANVRRDACKTFGPKSRTSQMTSICGL